MKNYAQSEVSFRRQLVVASIIFGIFFISLLFSGGYIIIKDLGNKEVFKILERYRSELEKMTTSISDKEIAKGFKYQKIVTTRINQFLVDKKIFDSYELYDSDGKLVDRQDYLKGAGLIAGSDIKNPPLGKSQIEIRNKVPIEVPVQLEPGKMGKAVLNISNQVLTKQAEEFRKVMIIKVSILLSLIFLMLLVAYFYVINLLRQYRSIQKEVENQNRLSYLGLLSSTLAHEIKNPLNSLKLNIQLLEEGLKGDFEKEELVNSIEPMLNQISRIDKLTRDFLIFAKPISPEISKTNLHQVAKEIANSMTLDKNVEIKIEGEEFASDVFVDESLFRIVFSNLLQNAVQASKENQSIYVKFLQNGDLLQIDVIDEGVGIKEEYKEKIFDLFFTTKSEGSGLGLTIVKRIVEAHNGKIEIVEKEKGAHFRIILNKRGFKK